MGKVFATGPGDRGSIDAALLTTQHYKVKIKGKVKQSREVIAPSPTPRCSSNWKGSFRVTNFTFYLLCYTYRSFKDPIPYKGQLTTNLG